MSVRTIVESRNFLVALVPAARPHIHAQVTIGPPRSRFDSKYTQFSLTHTQPQPESRDIHLFIVLQITSRCSPRLESTQALVKAEACRLILSPALEQASRRLRD